MNVNTILNNYDLDKDKKKNYSSLEKKINNLLELLEYTDNEEEQKNILNKINEIKELLSNTKIDINETYPSYNDKDFIKKLLSKKEFAMNKISSEDIKSIEKDFFELTNNQKFLKKFLSPETPYKTIYLYHSVGVGKTCASIQIADNFKNYYSKKVLVLLPSSTLKENYKKELFDLTKLDSENNNMEQCLGNYYLHKVIGRKTMDTVTLQKKVNKLINTDYEFLGYQEFVNLVEKIKKNSPNNKIYLERIKKYFDDRVIVVDEIHNMRMISDKVLGKKVPKLFQYVLSVIKNNVLVLLSATPMFNDYKEILFILNTILINNKLKKIDNKQEIFSKNNKLNSDFEKKLINVSSNFISYMRGENPYTFPIRIYPSVNKDTNVLKKEMYPKKDIYNNDIPSEQQIKYLEMIYTNMSDLQQKLYNTIKTKESNDDNTESLEGTDIQQRVQVSNIIYPSKILFNDDNLSSNFDIKNSYGETGLKRAMTIKDDKKFKVDYKDETIKNYGEIFDYKNIENYSPKIKLLLDYIKKSEGIVLIYSKYIYSGIIPIALSLEHLGYNKYNNNNLFNKNPKNKLKNKGSYIIISGNSKLSPNNTKEINICKSSENKNGDNIKIVIISESGTEGLDFKNVRETHIFEPWYNVNRLEQIIGRAVRNYSHFDLPEAKRNTTIFQYVNLTQKNKKESIDFRMYRISENKQKKISVIEKIIKTNSIDCNLNEEALSFKDITKNIITSQKTSKNELKLIKSYNIGDKPNTRLCDYGECDFKCSQKIDFDKVNLDESTYNKDILYYDIHIMKKYIINYFKNNNNALLKELKDNLQIKHNKILYFALNDLIKNKVLFKGNNNRLGYIINRSNSYIFQPYDINDDKILTKERKQNKTRRPKRIDITNTEPVKIKYLVSDENCYIKEQEDNVIDYNQMIDAKFKSIINLLRFKEKENYDEIKQYKKYIWDMLIDNLNKNELELLYKNIFKNNNIDEDFYKNILKSLNRSYLVFKDNKDNVVGLYNYFTDKFMCYDKNENKMIDCSPITENKYRDIQEPKILNLKNKDIKNFGYININKNNTTSYKIKDLEKLKKGDSVKGTNCLGTSTITNNKLINFINNFNKDILKSNKKYNNNHLCIIYQLVLRSLNNKKEMYFIRPGIQKLLKN